MGGNPARGPAGRRIAGNNMDFFMLSPQDDQVRVIRAPAPPPMIAIQCQGAALGGVPPYRDVLGNGVWVSPQQGEYVVENTAPIDWRQHWRFKLLPIPGALPKRRRHSGSINMASFWNDPNVTQNNTAVVIIDPVTNMMNAGRGGDTIGAKQIEVVHNARDNNIPIFEVNVVRHGAGAGMGRTPQNLMREFSSDGNGNQYGHLRTFQKPGARGANADDCLEYDIAFNNVDGDIWERTINAQIAPSVTFMDAINPYTNVIVMGQDGSQCVLSTIFGNWAVAPAAPAVPPAPPNAEYKPGLLDQAANRVVITSYGVVMTGAPAGALPACYCALRANADVPALWR